MSRYLATVLGLWALTTSSVAAAAFPALSQLNSSASQDSPQNGSSASPSTRSGAEPQATPASPESKQAQPDATAKKPETPAKAPSKKRRRRKSTASTSTAAPPKKIVRNGGTADPTVQLAPGMSSEQASRQRQSTTQLLAATDANLKQISSRPINSSQQDSVSQIRKYMEQAKSAEEAGDVERAYNLASKARLLSDDLVKH